MASTSKSKRKLATRAAALERDAETRSRVLQRRLAEAEALAPLAADKPEVACAPVANLWPNRRALLIINAKSGPNHDSIVHVRELVDKLAAFGVSVDVRVKLRKSQTRKEVRAAVVDDTYELVIAAGGDGTVEAVAAGLVGTRATLGIIPLGTYNNVATCLGIPSDVEQACALIACGDARRIDVGEVEAHYMKKPRMFLELSAVGLGAALGPLGQHVEKRRWDRAAQALPGVVDMSPTPTHLVLDGSRPGQTFNTLLVTVSNSPRSGAGLQLAPAAHMDDGLLDVCLYEDMTQPALLARFLPNPVGSPSTSSDAKVFTARARTLEIRTARPMPVSIESKLVGVTPARFSILSGALSVIAGSGDALLLPPSSEVIRASASAARMLASPPSENGASPARQRTAGLLDVLLPAAGRALDAAAGALGVAAASLWGPTAKRR